MPVVVEVDELDEMAGGMAGSEGLMLTSHRLTLFFKNYIFFLPLFNSTLFIDYPLVSLVSYTHLVRWSGCVVL